jgi:hypothetical protein
MSNDVYANGREVACKSGSGKSPCAFPDVCFTPPLTPATPPGVPVPYPNTGFESDTTQGSKTVKINNKEVMLRNKSYFSKSTGDEAGCAPKKNIITSVNRGKVYFVSWSMDVKFEGENVVRHLDLTTHNHASSPGATPPFPDLSKMTVGRETCAKIFAREHINVHRHGDKDCPDGYQSDHILQNACFENSRGGGGITTCPKYNVNDAPCICLKGKSTDEGEQHYKKTQDQVEMECEWRANGQKSVSYKETRDKNLQAVADSRSTPPSKAAMTCLKKVVDHYFKNHLGLKDDDPVRVPRTGRFRRPPGIPR